MRLQELFESAEEDRALISLANEVYNKITPYLGDVDYNTMYTSPEQELIQLGKIENIADTPLHVLNSVSIELQGNDSFIERAKDPEEDASMYEGKELSAFYEADTNTVVLNLKFINRHRTKTTITHELRHALDEFKSGSYPGNAKRYFTPKKKQHQRDEKVAYLAKPAEINARFVEILDVLTKRIPKWYDKLPENEIRSRLQHDLNQMFITFDIANLFPEKTKSKDYQRLIKRAYQFMEKEMQHVESERARAGTPKIASGRW